MLPQSSFSLSSSQPALRYNAYAVDSVFALNLVSTRFLLHYNPDSKYRLGKNWETVWAFFVDVSNSRLAFFMTS